MATCSSILAWKIPWARSLVGYSPWGHKESDTTERLSTAQHHCWKHGLWCQPGFNSIFWLFDIDLLSCPLEALVISFRYMIITWTYILKILRIKWDIGCSVLSTEPEHSKCLINISSYYYYYYYSYYYYCSFFFYRSIHCFPPPPKAFIWQKSSSNNN